MSLINHNNLNFFFSSQEFFLNTKNTISYSSIISFNQTTLNDYFNKGDETSLIPINFNMSMDTNNFYTNFTYFKNFSFIKFFINNMIDVPICFKKSYSLRTKNFELPLLKFSNFLMKKGKREKINNLIFTSLREFLNNIKLNNVNLNDVNLS